MKITKILVEIEGKTVNITDLKRPDYELFLALVNRINQAYNLAIIGNENKFK